MSGSIEVADYPIILSECKTSSDFKLFRETINTHHSYVKYKDSPTRRISFLIHESKSGNFIGVIGLSSGTLAIKCRENHIGWDNSIKMQNIHKIANNNRFCLIKDNITIKNAASMALKTLRITGAEAWKQKYSNELVLLETFILPNRDIQYNGNISRNGACYKADNWINIGMTEGHSIKKIPMLLWKKEQTERGKLARENPEECIKKYSYYVNNNENYGYDITNTDKKIVFIRPLKSDWLKSLFTQ